MNKMGKIKEQVIDRYELAYYDLTPQEEDYLIEYGMEQMREEEEQQNLK